MRTLATFVRGFSLAFHTAFAASPTMAAAVQPFVDGHFLAGAVTLVATPEKIR